MSHSCSHNHGSDKHAHGHGHSHAPTSFHKAFGIGIALNSLFVVIEILAGLYTGSLALVADAVHNLGDVLGLVLAWIGYYFAHKPASARFTFGFGRLSIFATIFNGAVLVMSSVWIVVEAIERWNAAPLQATGIVMIVAAVGIVINIGTALALMRGQHDINIKGAFLHMVGDAAVSAAVVLAALIMHYTGIGWIDPALGILVAGFIVWTSWPLLIEGLRLAIDGVPHYINLEELTGFIVQQPHILEVNDLRIWAISTTKTALSAHIVVEKGIESDIILQQLRPELQKIYGFSALTLQIEQSHQACITTA